MNPQQRLWWQQARSDYQLYRRLRELREPRVEPCHLLHYLQMAAEKLAKAYLWRSKKAPPKVHTGFTKYVKALVGRYPSDPGWAAKVLGFAHPEDAAKWLRTSLEQFVYPLENMPPDLSRDGPNPEYPWPHKDPVDYPAGYDFELWRRPTQTGQGRKFVTFIGTAIDRFPEYA